MKRDSKLRSAMRSLILGAVLIFTGALAQARLPGEQPIGWSKLRAANSPIKPIYASEVDKSADTLKAKADQMADAVKEARVNPEADSVEKAWPGSISLKRHQADVAEFRDQFTRCMTAMEHEYQAKVDSGTATAEDKAQFEKCMTHCKAVLATINDIHYNTSAMTTATRKIYFLNGWEKHKELMARLQEQMKSCPMMMKGTMDTLNAPGKGAKDKSRPVTGDAKDAAKDKK